MKPRTLILRTAGTNCDLELAHAFEGAGGESVFVHLNRLLERPGLLGEFQILAIPGGFSYGDDIAAGRILANQIKHHLHDAVSEFVGAGKPVIGVCNGFQVLVKAGLLPGPPAGPASGSGDWRQTCTLATNDCGRFVDAWVRLAPVPGSRCVWTEGIETTIELPVAHGEGKFVCADGGIRRALWESGQVALTYARADGAPAAGSFPENPNGSEDDIAGICDATGLVFGLMPHPERHVSGLQHPSWTHRGAREKSDSGAGLIIFRNAVGRFREAAVIAP